MSRHNVLSPVSCFLFVVEHLCLHRIWCVISQGKVNKKKKSSENFFLLRGGLLVAFFGRTMNKLAITDPTSWEPTDAQFWYKKKPDRNLSGRVHVTATRYDNFFVSVSGTVLNTIFFPWPSVTATGTPSRISNFRNHCPSARPRCLWVDFPVFISRRMPPTYDNGNPNRPNG